MQAVLVCCFLGATWGASPVHEHCQPLLCRQVLLVLAGHVGLYTPTAAHAHGLSHAVQPCKPVYTLAAPHSDSLINATQ
jgi:hypothetical protein